MRREVARRLASLETRLEARARASLPQPDLTRLTLDELLELERWYDRCPPGCDLAEFVETRPAAERAGFYVIAAKVRVEELEPA
jgi:hypothetical protein